MLGMEGQVMAQAPQRDRAWPVFLWCLPGKPVPLVWCDEQR
jgi:hypothetical protein